MPMYLVTNNPNVKSIRDFTDNDRISMAGAGTSIQTIVLQMAAAKEFGDANYARLDPITIALPHPEALTVMLSGKSEVNSHMASPPFSYIEDSTPGVHRVFSTVDVLGNITLDMTYASRRFFDANPKLCAAFIAAMEEANALIARDKTKAAQIYLAVSKQKSSPQEIVRILNDPNSKFSTVPDGTMKYAEFMFRVGTIKAKPASWKELFFPPIHSAAGS
jgi:NitT/TauT family transport system substrate-binding protein